MITTILSAVFGGIIFLLAIGAFCKMYIKPLIDKRKGIVDTLADGKDFKASFNKKNKKVKIQFKASYSNSAKAAIGDLYKELSKVDLENK